MDHDAIREADAISVWLLRFAWRSLLVFALLGLVLEALHAFKVGWYLDVTTETRRLLLRLGHAHGALLSVVALAFALCIRSFPEIAVSRARVVARLLASAIVALPGGFLLGGVVVHGGDPGLGIVLAPVGALLLLAALWLAGRR